MHFHFQISEKEEKFEWNTEHISTHRVEHVCMHRIERIYIGICVFTWEYVTFFLGGGLSRE